MATAPKQYTMIPGVGASYPGLVYADASGSFAAVTTPWYLNAAGIYVPAPVDANGNPQVSLAGSNNQTADNISEVGGTAVPDALAGYAGSDPHVPTLSRKAVTFAATGLSGYVPGLVVASNSLIEPTPYSGTATKALTASGVVKGSAGVVGSISNTGTVTSPTITVYDDATQASGTVLWTGTIAANAPPVRIGMPAANGIYIELSAAGNITASYA